MKILSSSIYFSCFYLRQKWKPSLPLKVPIATIDHDDDLDDHEIYEEQKWTCKKCTLVNSATSMTCEACYGSKLKSLTISNDTTLRKGEFWACVKCTLKNPLVISICKACKTERFGLDVPTPSRSPSPRRGNLKRPNSSGSNSKDVYAKVNHSQKSNHLKSINLKSDYELRKF